MCQLRPSSQYNFCPSPLWSCFPADRLSSAQSATPPPKPQWARVLSENAPEPTEVRAQNLDPCSQPLRSLRIAAAAMLRARHPGFLPEADWLLLVQPKSQSPLGDRCWQGLWVQLGTWSFLFKPLCARDRPGAAGQSGLAGGGGLRERR